MPVFTGSVPCLLHCSHRGGQEPFPAASAAAQQTQSYHSWGGPACFLAVASCLPFLQLQACCFATEAALSKVKGCWEAAASFGPILGSSMQGIQAKISTGVTAMHEGQDRKLWQP